MTCLDTHVNRSISVCLVKNSHFEVVLICENSEYFLWLAGWPTPRLIACVVSRCVSALSLRYPPPPPPLDLPIPFASFVLLACNRNHGKCMMGVWCCLVPAVLCVLCVCWRTSTDDDDDANSEH